MVTLGAVICVFSCINIGAMYGIYNGCQCKSVGEDPNMEIVCEKCGGAQQASLIFNVVSCLLCISCLVAMYMVLKEKSKSNA